MVALHANKMPTTLLDAVRARRIALEIPCRLRTVRCGTESFRRIRKAPVASRCASELEQLRFKFAHFGNRLNPWEYDRELSKRRHEVERLFRRLKGYRRIFSRFEKLDMMFTAFIHFALITEALICINTP